METSAEAVEGMGVVGLDVELGVELIVDGLDDLAGTREQATERGGELLLLVAAWDREEVDASFVPQSSGDGSADVRFVADHIQARMLGEQFVSDGQVIGVGWGGNGAKRRGRSPRWRHAA